MGSSNTYKCNKCGYSTLTSAGSDVGFIVKTDTYICRKCKEIVDVAVGLSGGYAIPGSEPPDNDIEINKCPICHSGEFLEKWKTRKRPCPKCDGKMEIDIYGTSVCWD